MKGFKAFDKDLKCREFQYKVGKTYTLDGDLKLCGTGFHFCEKLENVYGYYERSGDTRICEIEAVGKVLTEGDKSATDKIKIVREIKGKELVAAVLKGTNSGNRNSGNRNSGDYNSGDYNSGYYNSGNRNSGDYNSGDYNSGDYNSGNRNSGYFNSDTPSVRLFNKDSKLKFDSPEIQRLNLIISKVKPILTWVFTDNMTDEEKQNHTSHVTTGGFLRNSGRMSWINVTTDDFRFIKTLPNFNAKIFEELTGVDIKAILKEKK